MKPILFAPALLLATLCCAAPSQAQVPRDPAHRQELRRVDLTGAPGMEVVSSVVVFEPGETVDPHIHNGIEVGYVLQGATIQAAGKEPTLLATGANLLNLRGAPHGGFKVVGPDALKLYTVHIVDKGKPLYDAVK